MTQTITPSILTGVVIGRLRVLRHIGKNKFGHTNWLCKCDCGNECERDTGNLRSKRAIQHSCGCRGKEHAASLGRNNGTHRMSKSPEYRSYCLAKERGNNPKRPHYSNYGGRGIQFRFKSFEAFLACLGPKPSPRHSIDRYPNNNGHYEPGNVKWSTAREQAQNRRARRKTTCLTKETT